MGMGLLGDRFAVLSGRLGACAYDSTGQKPDPDAAPRLLVRLSPDATCRL
jgi:hypothetical protein